MDTIQLHFLTPYSAACLVRGQDGRPKSMRFGGVERGRISSASLKRAIRTSNVFVEDFEGFMGVRTARMAELVVERLVKGGMAQDDAEKGVRVLISGPPEKKGGKKGKDAVAQETVEAAVDDEGGEEGGAGDKKKSGARLFKFKKEGLRSEQLVFVSQDEINAAAEMVGRIVAGEAVTPDEVRGVVGKTTTAVDVAAFGRMMADRSDLRMTAAIDVAHPFTVGRALTEADFYVATDDTKPVDEDVGAGFMGEQGFNAGLFYGYARIDMAQLVRNLNGDKETARNAAAAFIWSALTVSPSAKRAGFGSHANATWAMLEVGRSASRSLAGAFMAPVNSDDHHVEAVLRAEKFAQQMRAAYNEDFKTVSMDVLAGRGSLAEMLEFLK